MKKIFMILIYFLVVFKISGYAFAAPINLSDWSVVQYNVPYNNPIGSWVLSNDSYAVTQINNAEPSIFLNGVSANHSVHPGFYGEWRVNTSRDDDTFGFVFGYQDRGQYYLFDWKQEDQVTPDGQLIIDGGMHMRSINVPGGADPTWEDLSIGTNTENMQILAQNDLSWVPDTDYRFDLKYTTDGFNILISEDNTILADWTITDSNFTSGQFGVFNHSQPNVTYTVGQVPIPGALWLFGTGIIGLLSLRRRQKSTMY